MSDMVAALQYEREGYVRRGLPDRVAQVDEQLALLAAREAAAAAEPEEVEPEEVEPPIEEALATVNPELAVSRGKRSRSW